MDEQQLQDVVEQAVNDYLAGLAAAGAPYTSNPAAWQQYANTIAAAAIQTYYAQGAPPSPRQGPDPAATLTTQIQQSAMVGGIPAAVDQRISTALAAGGATAAAALLIVSAPVWAGLIAVVGSNLFLWAAAAGAAAAATSAGFTTKTWKARMDDRTRHTHREAHGQIVPIGSAFTVGGFLLRYPHDHLGPPQETHNCRCKVRYGR
jgi:Phage Mu protein F like protein